MLHTSHLASMLGLFLHLTNHFKTGSLIFLARGPQFEYSTILRLLTMLETKVFKALAVLWPPLMTSSLYIKFILLLDVTSSIKDRWLSKMFCYR